ncbi:MAG TPA: stage III sporulation protein AA [Symbiobacteriaceae bacterium]|nr:stage III sporulation protein AA [Symbiobacteriaceae bacterium]
MLPAALRPFLPPRLASVIERTRLPGALTEIRLRLGRPVGLSFVGGDGFLCEDGRPTMDPSAALIAQDELFGEVLHLVTRGSLYAWEEEVRSGYLTLPGGHRVGLTGRALAENGEIRTLQPITGLNIRIARAVKEIARPLLPHLLDGGRFCSTLIIGPPGTGKTTLLRDCCRVLSLGQFGLCQPHRVGVVDERSEIGGAVAGVPTHDLGPRTDLLDGAPKALGLINLIRSMSPQVVAVDELGKPADSEAVQEALHAGVAVIATAHGRNLDDLRRRPALAALMNDGAFRRVIVLAADAVPGRLGELLIALEQGGWRAIESTGGPRRLPSDQPIAAAGAE